MIFFFKKKKEKEEKSCKTIKIVCLGILGFQFLPKPVTHFFFQIFFKKKYIF